MPVIRLLEKLKKKSTSFHAFILSLLAISLVVVIFCMGEWNWYWMGLSLGFLPSFYAINFMRGSYRMGISLHLWNL